MPAPDLFNLLKKVWHKHGFSSTVTRNALSLGAADATTGWYAKNYATSNIEMYIITKATKFLVLKQGLFIEYDGNGYTKDTVLEGDIITEPNGLQYLVLSVCDRNILNQFRYNEVGLKALPSAVTYGIWNKWDGESGAFNRIIRTIEMNAAASSLKLLFKLTLGAADTVTGWYLPTYSEGTEIKCAILDISSTPQILPIGIYTTYIHAGYTLDDVFEGDVIRDFNGHFHRVREVKTVQIGDHLCYYELKLERLDYYTVAKLGVPIIYIPEPQSSEGSGYFKRSGEIFLAEPEGNTGGGYEMTNGSIGLDEPLGTDVGTGTILGGAYIVRSIL